MGEIIQKELCDNVKAPHIGRASWKENKASMTQVVVSESAAQCAVNTLAKSDIGKITLSQEKLNLISKSVNQNLLNTSEMEKHISLVSKLGDNVPFELDL